jgi:cytidine deaminase
MKLDSKLVDAAILFVQSRFPKGAWAGAAAMYTQDGQLLISTAPEAVNPSVELCHETGAICEAHKLNKKITATVCVSRDENGNFQILTPCGVCQERLLVWGYEVEAAVPTDCDSTKWEMKTLKELQPYYWRKPFLK